jgi:ribosomal protein S18 acetylase RimI-like enzyme
MDKRRVLQSSRRQLEEITQSAYNDAIRPVALALWEKHLNPGNPQWKYIAIKPFYVRRGAAAAHVMAMVDSRLPGMGIVGYFACTDADTGAEVLRRACEWLHREYGFKDIYGPINGTLPNDYRLNQEDNYMFPGEPVNPLWHIEAFEQAGFSVFNRYVSGYAKHYRLLMRLTARRPRKGFRHLTVRPFNSEQQAQDFRIYHDLRNAIFPFQSVYCPAISLEERTYNSTGKFDPGYTYFLMDNGREVGFIMGYPYDNKLIMKTIAMLPEYRGKGLRGILVRPVRKQAAKDGLNGCIFAMVRVGNSVYRTRGVGVTLYRRYVTMHRSI